MRAMVLDRIRGPLAVREVPDPAPPQALIERVIGLDEGAALLPTLDTASPDGMTVIDPRRA